MTLPLERIGDKGQRYEVVIYGYPSECRNVVGWSGDRSTALKMLKAMQQAPGYEKGWVLDRETGEGHFLKMKKKRKRKLSKEWERNHEVMKQIAEQRRHPDPSMNGLWGVGRNRSGD